MSAPPSNPLALGASMTSSGFADGLGRRSLGFDREEGTMLERLTVRPELAAFASMLRERVDRLAAVEDERIARPRWIEHDGDGSLVVVSEYVPGSRLSDLLDNAAEQGAAPGLDAAFGYLLDVLPALCGLHAGAGFAHGTIAPSRTVLTPAGQVVLLDSIYGGSLSLLRYSSRKLWTEFSVAVPSNAGPVPLGIESDIGQVVLSSVMLVLGRPLYEDEFPDALPRVIADVLEIAQIRGTSQFASDYQAFLQRALPLPGRDPYLTADDALIDLRHLAGQLGIDACRTALVDFIEQMEPPSESAPGAEETEDDLLAAISGFEVVETPEDDDLSFQDDEDEDDEEELDLEELSEQPREELGADWHPDIAVEPTSTGEPLEASEHTDRQLGSPSSDARRPVDEGFDSGHALTSPVTTAAVPTDAAEQTTTSSVRSKRAKRTRSARARKDKLRSAATATPLATQKMEGLASKVQSVSTDSIEEKDTSASQDARDSKNVAPKPEHIEKPQVTTRAEKVDEPPKEEVVPNAENRASGNWLVAPGRAESFEPPVPVEPRGIPVAARPLIPVAPPIPPPIAQPAIAMPPHAATPPLPVPLPPPVMPAALSFTPQPPLQPPVGVTPPIPILPVPPRVSVPNFGAAGGWTPQPSAPPQPIVPLPPQVPAAPSAASVKLKNPVPPPRPPRGLTPADEVYGIPTPASGSRDKGTFPWKLGAGAIAAAAILIVAGRAYLPARTNASEDAPAATTAPVSREPSREPDATPRNRSTPSPVVNNTVTAPASAAGRIEIETQPAGAQIQLDGKSVGVSPLTLESVPAGRHMVTLTSTSGSVKRLVRVEGGRTVKIDVPIFSGWVGVFAPFVVEVAEGGRTIGTTEESRIMLSPGRHVLTLTNKDLGYRATETVEIEPGEVRSITLDPRGTVNLNASPWAEVWINGKKAGDTPLAGLQLPLGIQEVTFRHPELGERKVSVTVKGNQPAALSINMGK